MGGHMLAGTVIAAVVSYVLMVAAFYWHRVRGFHIPVMAGCVLFDFGMPVYLVLNRDWTTRLIEHGDILSFGVWMHFGLIIALFVLYAVQIQTALQLLHADDSARDAHHAQAKGILLVRALVIITGAVLAEPPSAQ
jgi:hypothetical protein